MVKWVKLCKSQKKGGVGIKNIEKLNISLLCKWWWKLENEDGLWQEIIKASIFLAQTFITFLISWVTHPSGLICSKLNPYTYKVEA